MTGVQTCALPIFDIIRDEDNMGSDDVNALATQQSIKAYVDSQVTAQDLDFQGDSGGALSIDLDSEVLGILGTANEIETAGSGNNVTIGLPNNVTITRDLTVGLGLAVTGVSTFTGALDVNNNVNVSGFIDVDGQTTLDDLNVSGVSTLGGAVDINNNVDVSGYIDVDGQATLDDLNVSGVSTLTDLRIGNANSIDIIRDEDNMASDDVNALATQQSIKAYVDSNITAQDLDFTGDTGSGAIDLDSQTFQVTGTPFEIVTTGSGQVLNVSLPDDVIIGAGLTVTSKLTVGGSATVGITTILDEIGRAHV